MARKVFEWIQGVLLAWLLKKIIADPRGFIPDWAWDTIQKAFALPYIELAIVRRAADGVLEILLSYRNDKDWRGWHLPGGLWRTLQTLEQGITALASRELGKGAQVRLLAKGDWEKWHDHPYGYPVSHVVICEADNVLETQTLRWFRSVPREMIDDHGHHARFIEGVFSQVAEQKLL